MKVYDIKWDVTDGTEEMTPEEIEEILAMLPKEIELPEEFDKANYMEDGEFDEGAWLDAISDWLSEDYGFCHDGFKISKEEKDHPQESHQESREEACGCTKRRKQRSLSFQSRSS